MGHRRLAGMLTQAEIAGASFIRIDVPGGDAAVTQFYSPSAVYAITPTTEVTARQVANPASVAPVRAWELPARAAVAGQDSYEWEGEPT